MGLLDHHCDCEAEALSRRAFLGGSLGSLMALLLAPKLRVLEAAAAAPAAPNVNSMIVLWLAGGPSHLDTFDPKPGRPTGGPFRAIPTAIQGVHLSEHLPRTAAIADRLAIVRSITSNEGNHQRARYYALTGYKPMGTVRHPSFGSILSQQKGEETSALPAYVSVSGSSIGPGFLGAAHAALEVRRPGRPVDNVSPAGGVDRKRFDRRLELLRASEAEFARAHPLPEVEGQRAVRDGAVAFMRSPKLERFDLEKEPAALRDAYGRNDFGQGCLLARRLVEAGVRCVEVTLPGWDTHQDNFGRSKTLLEKLDPALSALVTDLEKRKLLDSTLVVAMGEFGRTPRINANEGRDHYPRAFGAILAGGGLRRGVVVGATDENGEKVVSDPVTIPDLIATFCARLGVDGEFENRTPEGRPIRIVDAAGKPIAKLLAS